jgi:hypothetical protein
MQVRGARGPRARTYGDLTGKGKGQMPNRRHASDKNCFCKSFDLLIWSSCAAAGDSNFELGASLRA